MKKWLALILLTVFLSVPVTFVHADSKQSYTDYLFQFDEYRRMLNEFKVARGEYLKFKTLVSQTTALTKTIAMVSQRDKLLRAYLLFLRERLKENNSITASNKSLYEELINKEVTFLDNHSVLVKDIGSLQDAEVTSKQLSSHYTILQSNIVQTIVGITMGDLTFANQKYSEALSDGEAFITLHRGAYTPEKQATLDRWILQIKNKQSLYAQKMDSIAAMNGQLKSASLDELTTIFQKMRKEMSEAKQYLLEGTAYIGELREALYYVE